MENLSICAYDGFKICLLTPSFPIPCVFCLYYPKKLKEFVDLGFRIVEERIMGLC